MSCGPLTSETDSVSIKNIIIKKIMVKKFSNAQEVNMFSSSNVNFYTILTYLSVRVRFAEYEFCPKLQVLVCLQPVQLTFCKYLFLRSLSC